MPDHLSTHHGVNPLRDHKSDPEQARAMKRWTRELLNLPEDIVITVSELDCADPSCPIIETILAVHGDQDRRLWKFSRPKMAITKLTLSQVFAHNPGTIQSSRS